MESRYAVAAAITCAQPKGRLLTPPPPVVLLQTPGTSLSTGMVCQSSRVRNLPLSFPSLFPPFLSHPTHPFYFLWPMAVMATSAVRDTWPLEARWMRFPSKRHLYCQLSYSPKCKVACRAQQRWRSHRCWSRERTGSAFVWLSWVVSCVGMRTEE